MSAKVAVIGAGYVGLTGAACFAHLGHDVVCADVDGARVRRLEKGDVPILEAGLSELVAEGLDSGRLRFVVGAERVRDAESCSSVPTPFGDGGGADLSVVEDVVREIAPVLQPGTIIVNKSTMPVGSTLLVTRRTGPARRRGTTSVSCPTLEFLREARTCARLPPLQPHRDRVRRHRDPVRVSELYKGLQAPLLVTDPASAEMIKYASNVFLATKISFVNAIANLCEAVNADVRDVALGIGDHPCIGSSSSRRVRATAARASRRTSRRSCTWPRRPGTTSRYLRGVVEVNEQQRERAHRQDHRRRGRQRRRGPKLRCGASPSRPTPMTCAQLAQFAIVSRLVADGAEVPGVRPGPG